MGTHCADALKIALAESFVMYYRAHAYHWNVKGSDFHEYHAFFGMVADDVYGAIDPLAENIRKLGYDAPQSLPELIGPSRIMDVSVSGEPLEMVAALCEANDMVIEAINGAFQIATEDYEQGIADFLAARDDMHKKWRWQMTAILGAPAPAADIMPQNAPAPFESDIEDEGRGVIQHDGGYGYDEHMLYFGDRTEQMLADRVERYNKKAPASLQASIETVKTVYRRGALAASGASARDTGGMSRVDAFLRMLRAGRPANPAYTSDFDLLPSAHQMSETKDDALVASIAAKELSVIDTDSLNGMSPESVITSLTEFSGLGYGAEPAFRAAWIRAVNDGTDPMERVMSLATLKYESADSDLLPAR